MDRKIQAELVIKKGVGKNGKPYTLVQVVALGQVVHQFFPTALEAAGLLALANNGEDLGLLDE